MLTTDGDCKLGTPGTLRSIARVSATSCNSGISSQRKRGRPISTVNSPPSARQQGMSPAVVSNSSIALPVSALTSAATQRMPLPQAPASEPSLLKMRMEASVEPSGG